MHGRTIVSGVCGLALLLGGLGAWAAAGDGLALVGPGQLLRIAAPRPPASTGGVKVLAVDNSAALVRALGAARGGEIIRLAPGVYSGLAIRGVTPAAGVTITSADPAQKAVLTNFIILDSRGLSLSEIELATERRPDLAANELRSWAFQVRGSSNITFDHVQVHGSLDGNAQNDVSGLSILSSSGVTVTNSEFTQLNHALAFGMTDHVTVAGNFVHDVRTDGFDFAQVSYVEVRGNTFRNFSPVLGDHPDAIQFWTTGSTSPSHDILVAGNVILRGEGSGTQGIFFRDQLGNMPFQRVTISRNLVVGTGYNAIRIGHVIDLTVSDNHLVSFPGKANKSFMLINDSDRVTSTGNSAIAIAYDRVTNLTERGNALNGVADDLGLKAMKRWSDTHSEAVPLLAPFLGAAPPRPPIS